MREAEKDGKKMQEAALNTSSPLTSVESTCRRLSTGRMLAKVLGSCGRSSDASQFAYEASGTNRHSTAVGLRAAARLLVCLFFSLSQLFLSFLGFLTFLTFLPAWSSTRADFVGRRRKLSVAKRDWPETRARRDELLEIWPAKEQLCIGAAQCKVCTAKCTLKTVQSAH